MAWENDSGPFSEKEKDFQTAKDLPACNEEVLVLRAQEGNQQAFEMLYARYNEQITGYLTRMVGDNTISCELTQETFLKAWSALPGLRNPAFFPGWLYRIASNCARDYQKHQRRLPVLPLNTEALAIAGPEEIIEESELLELALAQVSPTYRSCLILYVIEDLSLREIAERLSIKENSVGKYVSRGKEELRQLYLRLHHEQMQRTNRKEKGLSDE